MLASSQELADNFHQKNIVGLDAAAPCSIYIGCSGGLELPVLKKAKNSSSSCCEHELLEFFFSSNLYGMPQSL